jgi:hypothetical protein
VFNFFNLGDPEKHEKERRLELAAYCAIRKGCKLAKVHPDDWDIDENLLRAVLFSPYFDEAEAQLSEASRLLRLAQEKGYNVFKPLLLFNIFPLEKN